MRKHRNDIILILLLIVLSIGLLDTCVSSNIEEEIEVDSSVCPIRKFFTMKKILWTFDDYLVQYDHHPPHKGFYGLSKKITDYGGHVNIMVIFTDWYFSEKINNEIRNISVVNDFGIPPEKIQKSLDFFETSQVYPQCHGWSNAIELNHISLEDAYHIVNHTLWNWKNNYDIKPHFFLGHSKNGNYNITVALKKFSEKYWKIYGENIRWYDDGLFPEISPDAPAIDFVLQADHTTEFDPLFGCDWGKPCETIEDAKELFNTYAIDKEIILIRGHPDFLNRTDNKSKQALELWEQWIDWIFLNHDIINMNHTKAIHYNKDRNQFKVFREDYDSFVIDMTNCSYDHNILFTQPYDSEWYTWMVTDNEQHYIGSVYNDTFYTLEPGTSYTFKTYDSKGGSVGSEIDSEEQEVPGFICIDSVFLIVVLLILIRYRKN